MLRRAGPSLIAGVFLLALARCELAFPTGSLRARGAAGADASAGGMGGSDAASDAVADAPTDQSVGPLPSHGLGCALWPGNKPLTVGCPSGQVITGFSTVLYGNPTGSCNGAAGADGSAGFQPGTCNAGGAKAALEKLCDGLASCTFVANANLQAFTGDAGDPCSGTSKSIAVQVECGPAPVPEAGSEAGAATLPQDPLLDFDATDFKNNSIGSALPGQVWNDSSPNHDNATVPSGAASPTVGVDQRTGKGLVRFSGNSQYLQLNNPLTADLSKGLTAFALVAPLDISQQTIFDFADSSLGKQPDAVLLQFQPGRRSLEFAAGPVGALARDVFNTNRLELFALRAAPAPAVGSSLQKVTMYKGGVPVFEQFMPAPANVPRNLDTIGNTPTANKQPASAFDGYMARLVVYNRALSDPEMASAREALMSSWDLCTATDTQTDPTNCGYCGHLCVPGQTCKGGVCEGSMFTQCNGVALPDTTRYHALCQPGGSKVSWVQARNACEDLGGDLISIPDQTMSNAIAGAANGPVLAGLTDFGTSSFEWSDGTSASFSAWGGGAPPTAKESCSQITGGSNWQPVSCTSPEKVPWLCSLPLPDKGTCNKFLEPKTQRAWDICTGEPPNDLLRRAACKSEGGKLIAVQSQNEATLLGDLLVRYPGSLPAAAIDLTDGVTPFDWTLHDGTSPPFIDWQSGEPSVGDGEPRCGALAIDGTMTAAPCDAHPQPVICSLPDGTAPDQALGTPPPSDAIFVSPNGPMDLSLSIAGGGNTKSGITPGASIALTLHTQGFHCFGPPVPFELSFSPGTWKTCVQVDCLAATTQTTIQAPPVAGVFDLVAQPMQNTNCTNPSGPPQVFGRIAVAP